MLYSPTKRDNELERGLDLARQAGHAALEQERAEQERAEQEAQVSMHQMLAGLEAQAVRSFGELQDAYDERRMAAQAAVDALAKFAELEAGIRTREAGIVGSLAPALNLMPPNRVNARIQELRKRAQIPERHDNIETPAAHTSAERIAETALRAIARGYIGAGAIGAGGRLINV